jgi:thioesterase domain-containing protein
LSEILENNPATGGEEEVKEERWHLYLAPFNSETAAIAMAERYARAMPTHVMIYNEKDECPDGFKEMTEETLYLLPVEDRKWLKEVNNIIIQQFIVRHMEEQERANKKFLEEFERELQKEREKLLQQGSEA